jgi:probable phosphoglycerate mutase
LQTAEYIARACNLPVQPLDGLIDMDFGEWQGLSLEEAQARDGELYRLWLDHPHRVTFPGGESLEQVRARLTLTLKDLCARHPEQSIVLVSHKVICKVLLCLLLGLDNSYFWRVEKDTCAISIIEMRHTVPRITLLNDTCHLKGLS